MRHLTDEQIADAAGGAVPSPEMAHLSACAACASRVRELEGVLREVGAVDVPEPSPLFWQHLAQQIGQAIDRPQPAGSTGRLPWAAAWAAAAVVVIGLITMFVLRPAGVPRQVADAQPRVEDAPAAFTAPDVEPLDIDEDEAWAVVRSLAEELHYDDAREAGVVPRPGAVERAATELSDDERARLMRLLEAALNHRGNTDGD